MTNTVEVWRGVVESLVSALDNVANTKNDITDFYRHKSELAAVVAQAKSMLHRPH